MNDIPDNTVLAQRAPLLVRITCSIESALHTGVIVELLHGVQALKGWCHCTLDARAPAASRSVTLVRDTAAYPDVDAAVAGAARDDAARYAVGQEIERALSTELSADTRALAAALAAALPDARVEWSSVPEIPSARPAQVSWPVRVGITAAEDSETGLYDACGALLVSISAYSDPLREILWRANMYPLLVAAVLEAQHEQAGKTQASAAASPGMNTDVMKLIDDHLRG